MEIARVMLQHIRVDREGATFQELVEHAQRVLRDPVSKPNARRALYWLRDEQSAPIVFEGGSNKWRLTDTTFSLPLLDPTPDDLTALVFAGALLESLGDEDLNNRVRRMIEEMDAKIREMSSSAEDIPRGHAVTATLTTSTPVDPHVLATLVRAVRRHVVRFDYRSPWTDQVKVHEVEPWILRCHDGRLYLRGHARAVKGPLNYRISYVQNLSILHDRTPSEPVPPASAVWAEADLAFGVDVDRPATAKIRVEGSMARWVFGSVWHPMQEDTWIEDGKVLQRVLPYGSCREMARRLLSLGSSLTQIEPEELKAEVREHATSLTRL